MKPRFLALYSILVLAIFYSCSPQKNTVIYAQLSSDCDESFDIITERLQSLYLKNAVEKLDNGHIAIHLYDANDTLYLQQLFTPGNIYIAETYEIEDVFSNLVKINEMLAAEQKTLADNHTDNITIEKTPLDYSSMLLDNEASLNKKDQVDEEYKLENPLFSLIHIGLFNGVIGSASTKDTAAINTILNRPDVKWHLFRDLTFLWTANSFPLREEDPDAYSHLIAVKTTYPLEINGTTTAKVSRNRKDDDELQVDFKGEYVNHLARMTYANIGRSLVVVMDDKVVCHPKVNSPVTNGSVIVSGAFTTAGIINAVANSVIHHGELKCNVQLEK